MVESETLILIDAGAEPSSGHRILDNVLASSFELDRVSHLLLTHGHVDHIGGVKTIVERTGCHVVCHEGDAEAIRTGDPFRTASSWYGVSLPHIEPDIVLVGDSGKISALEWIHVPGHTPGSIALTFASPDGLVLFGQDIHGPFSPDFDSDIDLWAESMRRLIALNADILCEGHFGVYRGADRVRRFIESHLRAHGFHE